MVSSAAECELETPVNINSAGAETLETLVGIGSAKSAAIIEYRNTHGSFTKTVDIQEVSGIGPVTYENIKLCITVGDTPPGPENTNTGENETQTDSESSSEVENNEAVSLIVPDDELVLTIDAPDIAYVNQPITLTATPNGIANGLRASVQYTWNLGDMHTATGAEVTHAYAYPGEYVIAVDGAYARHQTVERHEVTVLPVNFSITHTATGDIQINNDARYEVDISGYTLQGNNQFVFPENTIVLPRATITVPRGQIADSNTPVALYDQRNTFIAHGNREQTTENTITASSNKPAQAVLGESTSRAIAQENGTDAFTFDRDEVQNESSDDARVRGESTSVQNEEQTPTQKSDHIPREARPYLGLIAVITVGIGALYLGGYRKGGDVKDV